MNIEIIIISAIILLASISIILAIINWLNLSFASSKISILEEAIEKKSKEFDALKKERQSSISQAATTSAGGSFTDPLQSSESAESLNPPIEIVRNYRTGFKTVEIEGAKTAETLDVVNNTYAGDAQNPFASEAMEIILFSETRKDTDFENAWKMLTSYLSVSEHPSVVINFNNVLFLYEKELHYLEKMCEVVVRARGSIRFAHYHNELRSIISTRPMLSRLLRE
jgi:hypothetical protein